MNISTANFSTPEETTQSTPSSPGPLACLEISFHILNVLFGLPTHSCIIWLVITSGGVTSEFFILNLSICEIGNCVCSIFAILIHWILSIKTLAMTLFGLFFTSRPVFQCMICVERYLAVVHPVTFLKYKPLRYKVISSTAAWILCLGFCLCFLLLFEYYMVTYVVLFSTTFILFLSVQLFCCLAVLRALKRSGPGLRGREEGNNMKRRAFHLILITVVSMVMAYLPYSFLGFFAVMTTQFVDACWYIGLICFVLCGFVQPVLYLNRAGKLNRLCST